MEGRIVELLGAKINLGRFQEEYNSLFECIQDDLNKITEHTSAILNQKITYEFRIAPIWQLEGELGHLHYVFRLLYKILAYGVRKKNAYDILITFGFEKKNSLIEELKKGVMVMNYLSITLPMRKDVSKDIVRALDLINNFEDHGHYLLHLPQEEGSYRVRDLLLYLHYFNRIYFEIYKLGVESVYRNIKYNVIQQNDR
jgi:hypothetical protein